MADRLVIIGAGMGAGRLLERLTASGSGDTITLFNAEPRGSYNRLMLSPVLAGETTYADIVTHDDAWYAAHNVTTRFGERVLRIDTDRKCVEAENGQVPYDKLVIATGSTPFMIPLPGHDLEGVIAYRDLEDTERMMRLGPDHKAVVIGGGLLGLEAAAGMAARGVDVTVVHIMDHLMERQLDPEAARLLQSSLEGKGIKVLCAAHSAVIEGKDGHVTGLALKDGRVFACDLLVMAVGIRPATAVAVDAGLKVEKGIVVDDKMRTSQPDIFAIGECVEHRGALFGLVAPIYDQAAVLADVLTGRAATFVQKSLSTKLKVTGCDLFSAGDFAEAAGRESITFRDDSRGAYTRLVLENDRLIGAVMYGDTTHGSWYFDLIERGEPLGDLRDTLVFGPDVETTPLPRSSLAA